MLVWANLHASYIFGLALVGLFALEALIAEPDRRRVIVGWGGFGLAGPADSLHHSAWPRGSSLSVPGQPDGGPAIDPGMAPDPASGRLRRSFCSLAAILAALVLSAGAD